MSVWSLVCFSMGARLVRRTLLAHLFSAAGGRSLSNRPLPVASALHRRQVVHAAGLWCAGRSQPSASADEPEPDNIFLRILRGEAPAQVLDDSDDELFSFVDRNPASTIHYLVIPRRFVRDASALTPSDAELVRSMRAKAVELVQASVGEEFDESELALGFHWPPFGRATLEPAAQSLLSSPQPPAAVWCAGGTPSRGSIFTPSTRGGACAAVGSTRPFHSSRLNGCSSA